MNSVNTKSSQQGFTLVELLLVMAGVSGLYLGQQSARSSEDLSQTVEAQLRTAMDRVMFSLRSAGYGAPKTNLSAWIPWVASMTTDPKITLGAGASDPDTVSIALCTSK